MRKKLEPGFKSKLKKKNPGATLVITIILCGLILGMSLGLVSLISSELQFSSDLLFSERAYFAAESGIESALKNLQEDPLKNVPTPASPQIDFKDIGTTAKYSIENLKSQFSFTLPAATTERFSLRKGSSFVDIPSLTVSISGNDLGKGNLLLWKIVCPDPIVTSPPSTIALIGRINDTQSSFSFSSTIGNLDPEGSNKTGEAFWNEFQGDKTKCYLFLQNLRGKIFEVTLSGTEMVPDKANVKAVGSAGNRTKIVEFDRRQTRISPFFDFGFVKSK